DKQHHRAYGGGEETHPKAVHGCPDVLADGSRLDPSHADPFRQHCGSGRSPRCSPIKAAAWRDAKMAKCAPPQISAPPRPAVAWHRRRGTIRRGAILQEGRAGPISMGMSTAPFAVCTSAIPLALAWP